jgi:hypothetical protein
MDSYHSQALATSVEKLGKLLRFSVLNNIAVMRHQSIMHAMW